MKNMFFQSALCVAMATTMVGCGSDNDGGSSAPTFEKTSLIISHINDQHSFLKNARSLDITATDGLEYEAELGRFARATQFIKDAEAAFANDNFLKLHAGDAITGTTYFSFFKGEADAAMMNTVCFDAFALGNHEFDEGDAGLVKFLDWLNDGTCPETPALAANVVPEVGTPLAMKTATDYIKPYIIKETKEGVKVGIIGIDIAGKTKNSSRPLSTTQFLDEVTTAQNYITELKGQGIEHIVLLTHQGYENDKAMAAKLTGVDVIIGGDSHTLLGDFTRYGIESSGDYPTIVKNKDGDTVCIGQAWEYMKAVGLMDVQFNDKGSVDSCTGSANILVGETFTREYEDKNGDDVEVTAGAEVTANTITKLTEDFAQGTISGKDYVLPYKTNAAANAVFKSFNDQVAEKEKEVVGTANSDFCLIRVPGGDPSRSEGIASCKNVAERAKGSDAAQIVATSFLDASLLADFALQNAGGVRTPIASGEINYGEAVALLPFGNTLVEFEITGKQVVDTLENAVDNHLAKKGSSGSHPYAAGLRWDLDMSKAKGNRFTNLEVKDRKNGTWSTLNLEETYTLVTNNYIAEGRDGYTTLGTLFEQGKVVDTFLLYTDSFINYVKKLGKIDLPARDDYSHKTVITKDGKTLNKDL